jgi:choline dehydrogenase-like flavoprotein
VDDLGMRRLCIDWRYRPEDIASIGRTLGILATEFERSGVGQLQMEPASLEDDLLRYGAYGGHHIGTARMGQDPRTSVVDSNARVHDVANLYIAGSAVFPTSSQANPTLTLLALSLRLADHLTCTLRPDGASTLNPHLEIPA